MKVPTIEQQRKALKSPSVRKHITGILRKSGETRFQSKSQKSKSPIPQKWADKINSGELRAKHGLPSHSKSQYARLRVKYGDTEAQYICFVSRGIIPRPKKR